MSTCPFPKPSPTDPLPFDEWLILTDRAEVGREAFFRGRDTEYDVFRDAVISLKHGHVGGGTMIFQGAPGAGKTALMTECMEAIRVHSTPHAPWVAVDIKPGNLRSPIEVVMLIIDAVNAENERLSMTMSDSATEKLKRWLEIGRNLYHDLSERGGGIAGFSIGGKTGTDLDSKMLSQRIFVHVSEFLKDIHIVVFVDEAQNTPIELTTPEVVDCLHNPPANIPMLTAFFGLSDTQSILRQCGLSRFARGRIVTLDILSHEDTASAIQSVFDAYGFKGSVEDQATWVNALADLSQGWPQHINSVCVAAAQVIRNSGKRLEDGLLSEAIVCGQELKEEYYAFRLAACSEEPFLYKQIALMATKMPDEVLTRSSLNKISKSLLKDSQTTFEAFLTDALHAGILMEIKELPKHYRIPIPSLGDYLRALP